MGMALVPGGNSSTFPFTNNSFYLPLHYPNPQGAVILRARENPAFFKRLRFFPLFSLISHGFPLTSCAVKTGGGTMP